jgi:hypothetical protein
VDETTRSSYVIQHIEPSSEQLHVARRHHPLDHSANETNRIRTSVKLRQNAATNLSQFVAFCRRAFAAFCRLHLKVFTQVG